MISGGGSAIKVNFIALTLHKLYSGFAFMILLPFGND
jgi:hypothetical protein